MTDLIRFGVSLEKDLLDKFDGLIGEKQYASRSEAIRDLIRDALVQKDWESNREITGAITLVYDHHKRELVGSLMHIQHEYPDAIISAQHIHLDHHNCLEVVVVKGRARRAEELFHRLKSAKGVMHAGFTGTTTGENLK